MEKHANTWFPGDAVVKNGVKLADGSAQEGKLIDVDPALELAHVTWKGGVTEWVDLSALSKK